MKLLAVESSCDDTAAAVLEDGAVRSSIVASQDDVHRDYGGVVPELASRSHIRAVTPTVTRALADAGVTLDDIDAVAATFAPGLVGSLLVGLCAAKAIAYARQLPFIGINHLEGHLLSVQLERPVEFPYVALLVSGGHTSLYLARALGDYELLGATRDDAAGEAFDKVAKLLGLGYPGGRVLDALARGGNPEAIRFPRARLKAARRRRFDFSFSGIKTAVALHVREHGADEEDHPDIAASFQEAVIDMLLEQSLAAADACNASRLVLAGGVSANSRLRARAAAAAAERGLDLIIPSLRYCTDNAAMIGLAAHYRLARGERDDLTLNAAAVADVTRPRTSDAGR
ncbi:MAG TPA: tRNA (adenosine(37)-N6)-threonylcarbamoyltransferase complex transferase subunit TsaD [Candidatus Dormibacteraeota bacterium]|nr:tRNA (adenosine(37)-N6)-threonylcarbamoyltransferase complex transferase subunit TsaD [Candidatus Dormibacteraeota bacterium]